MLLRLAQSSESLVEKGRSPGHQQNPLPALHCTVHAQGWSPEPESHFSKDHHFTGTPLGQLEL